MARLYDLTPEKQQDASASEILKKVFDEKDQPIEIGYSLFSGKYLEIDRQKILIADHYKGLLLIIK